MALLGRPLPDVAVGGAISPDSFSDAELDELFDVPAARSLDILLSAEPKGRSIRGGKGIDINRRVAPATVFLQQGAHLCSGTLVGTEGRILTCWHCVRSGGDILVRLHPDVTQRPLTRARLLRADPGRDLALLQLAEVPPQINPLELGRATDIEVGTDVYAVGHPSGLAWSLVKGMVSQIYEKRIWNFEQNRHEAEVIQSQIPLYPGNSGGPLVTDHGLLIGVNAARRENESFTFAISISEVRSFLGGEAAAPELPTRAAQSCKRRKLAEGRNAENNASVALYDTDCDGKADTALIVPDDALRPLTVARAGEGGEQINVVRSGRDGRHSIRNSPRLAETADELRAMGKTLKAGPNSIWLQENATETRVKGIDLSKYRTIAFATHGAMAGDIGGVGEAGLILTPPKQGTLEDDGYLSASEIAKLKLNADWVVLSACNTAAADGTPGAEGLSGLAKAFFYAGARSLFVSHWPVASDATVPLTTSMLREYEANPGQGKAEAHRKAMMALMATPDHPEYAHPIFWAPFVIVGEGAR